ncbi:MAG: hypothetical protein Q7T82_20570 [Armatimonadota bacterium]|nr:hypothetical protein [Armatimonadota bacterium]
MAKSLVLPVLLLLQFGALAGHARNITFAGREWIVKAGYAGPGPNLWSGSTDSVWVDASGLHLKVRNVGGEWYCAEVYSVAPTGHGMHRFHVDGRVDLLDKNIVLGLFAYATDNEEIDIEFSRWGQSSPPNAGYNVQPYYLPGNSHPFTISLFGYYSTHYFDWQPEQITFKSLHGHYDEPPGQDDPIEQWLYSGGSNPPVSAFLRIHINLWLVGGQAPSDSQDAEIIITDADLPPVRVATIAAAKDLPDEIDVSGIDGIVSASFPDFFYIQSDSRECGIRVEKQSHGISERSRVKVAGTMETSADCERRIRASTISIEGPGEAIPVALQNIALGGADWRRHVWGNRGQQGVTGGFGLNNIGLLTRCWGRLTEVGAGLLWVDDGSRISTDTGRIGVRIETPTSPPPQELHVGDYVAITGVSGLVKLPSGDLVRRVLTRSWADVVVLNGS